VPDPHQGNIGFSPALENLRGAPFGADLAERLKPLLGKLKIVVENDGNAMALAERLFGSAKELTDFVVLRLCTGLGGGMLVRGVLYRGWNGLASEVGHFPVDTHGERCWCGAIGCLETVASGRRLLEAAKKKTNQDFQSYVDVINSALNGKIKLNSEFERIGRHVGTAVAAIMKFMSPQSIILGGPGAKAYPLFETSMREMINQCPEAKCDVVPSNLERSEVLSAIAAVTYHLYTSEKTFVDSGSWPSLSTVELS
jgi:glucokinase